MIVGVVILHIWALHVPGNNNPTGVPIKSGKDAVPFHPYVTVKDGFSLVVFLIFFAWLVFYLPNYLGHADNYIPANPAVTPAHIVPEWYFLPFYAILRAMPDKLGGVIAMFGSIAILAFLPWLDTSRVRSAAYRPLYKIFSWVFVGRLRPARLARLEAGGGALRRRRADRDGLLLRPLPRHHPAARPDREAAAPAELDPGERVRPARRTGPERGRHAGRRRRRAAGQGLNAAFRRRIGHELQAPRSRGGRSPFWPRLARRLAAAEETPHPPRRELDLLRALRPLRPGAAAARLQGLPRGLLQPATR